MPSAPLSLLDVGLDPNNPLRLWNHVTESTPGGPTKSKRMSRPGLVNDRELGAGPVRATFTFSGSRITVSAGQVFVDAAAIGAIPAFGPVRFATSDEECVIVANHRAYYVTLLAVTLIADPDLPNVRDVLVLAGRFVYVADDNTGRYFWSETNDAQNISGLSFASAESAPDPITGALVVGDNILFLGTDTGEWHYPTDDITAPYQRSRGRRYDKGCSSIRSIVNVDNSGFWVGSDRIIYRTGAVPQPVSDNDMNARLQKLSDADLELISAYPVTFSGHVFYVVNLPGLGTWALDISQGNRWSRWTTWMKTRFRVDVADGTVLGDYYTGRLMHFSELVFTDMEDSIERVSSTFVPLSGGVVRNTNVVLHCVKGQGLVTGYGSDPHVEMRFSDHEGADWSVWMEAELGAIGDRSKQAMAEWIQLGMMQSPGRVYEFRCTDPVFYCPYGLVINQSRP